MDLIADKEAALALKAILTAALGKSTFRAIWRFVQDVVDYDATFSANSTGTRPLAYFFIRIVFTTLAPMLFQLINKEKALNANKAEGDRNRNDQTFRTEIIETYKTLTILTQFADVDKEIFTWLAAPVKKCRFTRTDRIIASRVWDDEVPPAPPANYTPRQRIQSIYSTPGTVSPVPSAQSGSTGMTPGGSGLRQSAFAGDVVPTNPVDLFQVSLSSSSSGGYGNSRGDSGSHEGQGGYNDPFGGDGSFDFEPDW